jgi:SAM-dependent methyltransferase
MIKSILNLINLLLIFAHKLIYYSYLLFKYILFDPLEKIYMIIAFPYFLINISKYICYNNSNFNIKFKNIRYKTHDRFEQASNVGGDYFFQDLWAAKILYINGIREHVDVGSRIDGFITHILVFAKVTYIDLRPLIVNIDNFEFKRGSILHLPFESNSVESISCLHVLEHIGLGRYGDLVDPEGFSKAARELIRVIKPGGMLLIGTPVGQERVCFDAHRIFDPQTVLNLFKPLRLKDFRLIDDSGALCPPGTSMEVAQKCKRGCGLYFFIKS